MPPLEKDHAALSSALKTRLEALRARIERAGRAAGRPPLAAALVAVTKSVPGPVAAVLAAAGQRDLGESRAQDLETKARWFEEHGISATWHFVGHLQRNKARAVVRRARWIHSVDSLRLLDTLERVAAEEGVRPRVLLEVDLTSIEGRHGLAPAELETAVARAAACAHLELAGLMTMAPPPVEGSGQDAARAVFRELARLRAGLAGALFAGGRALLSMGMSADFEVAIAEGADLVRVGTLLLDEPGGGP